MKINLKIDRLVLNDLPSSLNDRRVIQKTVTRELSTLLTKRGINAVSQSHNSQNFVKNNEITIGKQTSSWKLGTQIAGSIVEGLGK